MFIKEGMTISLHSWVLSNYENLKVIRVIKLDNLNYYKIYFRRPNKIRIESFSFTVEEWEKFIYIVTNQPYSDNSPLALILNIKEGDFE